MGRAFGPSGNFVSYMTFGPLEILFRFQPGASPQAGIGRAYGPSGNFVSYGTFGPLEILFRF
jgi:hypothetical protein